MNIVATPLAFVVAIIVLVAVHEWGHFLLARLCGVKVLKFSIGFGPALKTFVSKKTGTHYVLSAIPLGGFVKMLDEREGSVADRELPYAFNRQAIYKRFLIVLAGPLFNLLFAIFLLAAVNWSGVWQAKPVIGPPAAASVLAKAGLKMGDTVLAAGDGMHDASPITSFEDLRWKLTGAALSRHDLWLRVKHVGQGAETWVNVPFAQVAPQGDGDALLEAIGLKSPYLRPVVVKVNPGEPAAKAGLRAGDVVLAINNIHVTDAKQLIDTLRQAGMAHPQTAQEWTLLRDKQTLMLPVMPDTKILDGKSEPSVGIYVGEAPDVTLVRYGFLQGIARGSVRVWEISTLTLRSIKDMLMGALSVKNISGPITIAEYAGQSAQMGWQAFLTFLAFISVSLGVMNLLPLPVLDGGHLVYYIWEVVTGRAVSEKWMERLQQIGLAVLVLLMALAIYNDITRL